MTPAETTTTCGGCCTLGSDTLWPWCQTHNRRTTECIRALEEERDGLRAKMGLWASQYEALVRSGELSITTEAFAEEIARRIRAALDGEGKP